MENFTNPLNNIKIASPCSANWEEMYGDNRKRFCGECKLNVYNLSGMTKAEAENLLSNSEGRLCVRFYRRNDGTILTQDCPVGWQAIKKRVSGIAAAAFSMIVGLFGGFFVFNQSKSIQSSETGAVAIEKTDEEDCNFSSKQSQQQTVMGNVAMPVTAGTPVNLEEVIKQIIRQKK